MDFGMLLSSVSGNGAGDTSTIATVCGLVIIIGVIALVCYVTKKKGDPAELDKFLTDLAEDVKVDIVEILSKYTVKDIEGNFMDIYNELVTELYNDIYDRCIKEIEVIDKEEPRLAKALTNALSREKIQEYVDTILDQDKSIQAKITEIINIAMRKQVAAIEAEDAKLEKELKKDEVIDTLDRYEKTDIDSEERDVKVLGANNEPIEEEINPPKEDEDDSVDDGTYEVVDDKKDDEE